MQITQLNKVLVANRGEIAVRIFRACYDLGLHTVAIYSNEDTYSIFRTKADEAYLVGEKKSPLGAYLDIPGIISLARRRGVTAIHPGYGFLSENADFARACEANGILFVGPSADVLAKMGDKLSAKEIALECGVPTIPGCTEPLRDADDALEKAVSFGFPVILKAAAGGGGRGVFRRHGAVCPLDGALRALRRRRSKLARGRARPVRGRQRLRQPQDRVSGRVRHRDGGAGRRLAAGGTDGPRPRRKGAAPDGERREIRLYHARGAGGCAAPVCPSGGA